MQYSKEMIEEKQLGIKYIQGRLTEQESEKFESYLMDNPSLIDDLQMDMLLNDNWEDAQQKQKTSKDSIFSKLKHFWYGLFGSGVGALASYLFLTIYLSPQQAFITQEIVTLDVSRSSSATPTQVMLPSDERYVFLLFSASPEQQGKIDVLIRERDAQQTVFETKRVTPTEMGDISLVLDTKGLRQGVYEVEITDSDAKRIAYNFEFLRE